MLLGSFPTLESTIEMARYAAHAGADLLLLSYPLTFHPTTEDEIFATITRINPDGSGREIFARGIRNSVGFTWHPETKEMWFTDNGRDMMGDDLPPCELNKATKAGMHFGYPYCHAGDIGEHAFVLADPVRRLVSTGQDYGVVGGDIEGIE